MFGLNKQLLIGSGNIYQRWLIQLELEFLKLVSELSTWEASVWGWGGSSLDSCQLKWASCREPFFTLSCSPFISIILILPYMLVLFNLCWMYCCIADSVQWAIENIKLLLNVLQDAPINLKLLLNANGKFMLCSSDRDIKIYQIIYISLHLAWRETYVSIW